VGESSFSRGKSSKRVGGGEKKGKLEGRNAQPGGGESRGNTPQTVQKNHRKNHIFFAKCEEI